MLFIQLNGGHRGRFGLRHYLSGMFRAELAKQDEAISYAGMCQGVVWIFGDGLSEVFNSRLKLLVCSSAPGVSPPEIKLVRLPVLCKAFL